MFFLLVYVLHLANAQLAPTIFSTACLSCCRGEGQCEDPEQFSVSCCTSPDRCCLKPDSTDEYTCCSVDSSCVRVTDETQACMLSNSSCPSCCLGTNQCSGLGSADGSCCASQGQCCQKGTIASAGNFECCATGSACTVIATNPIQRACTALTRNACPALKTCQDCTIHGCFWTKSTCVSTCPKGASCKFMYNTCSGSPPTSSCVRRCGSRALGAKCHCDSLCTTKKDCCPDILQACPRPTPAPFPGPVFPVQFRFVENDECPSSNCDCGFDFSVPTNGFIITFAAFDLCTTAERGEDTFHQKLSALPGGSFRVETFEEEDCSTPTPGTTTIARAQLNRCVTCVKPNLCKYYLLDATGGVAVTGNRVGPVIARLNFPIKWTRVFGCDDLTCSCAANGFTAASWSVGLQGLAQCTSVVFEDTTYYALVSLRKDGLYALGTYSDEFCTTVDSPAVLFDSKQLGRCQDVTPVGQARYMVEEISLPLPLLVQLVDSGSCGDTSVSWGDATGFVIEALGQCVSSSSSAQIVPQRNGVYELFVYDSDSCSDDSVMDGFPVLVTSKNILCKQVGAGIIRTMPKLPAFPLLLTLGSFPNGVPAVRPSFSDCTRYSPKVRTALLELTDFSETKCVSVTDSTDQEFSVSLVFGESNQLEFSVYNDDSCSDQFAGPLRFVTQDVDKSCLADAGGQALFTVERARLPFPVRFRLITQCGTVGCKAKCQNIRAPSISVGFNATDVCVAVETAGYKLTAQSNGLYSVDVYTDKTCTSDEPISYVFGLKDLDRCRLTGTTYFSVTTQKLSLPLEFSLQNKCKAGTVCTCPFVTAFPIVKVAFLFFEICHPALNEGSGFQTYTLNFSPKGFYEVRLYKDYNCLILDKAVFNFDASEIRPYGKCINVATGVGKVSTLFPQILSPTASPTTDPLNGLAFAWALAINVAAEDLIDDSFAARNLRTLFSEKLAVSASSIQIRQFGTVNASDEDGNLLGTSLLFEAYEPNFDAARAAVRLGGFRFPLENVTLYDSSWSAVFAPFGPSEQLRSTVVFYQAFLAFEASIRETVVFVVSVPLGANPEAAALAVAQKQLGGNTSNYYCSSTLFRGGNTFVLCEVLPPINSIAYMAVVAKKKFIVLGTCWPGTGVAVFREGDNGDQMADAVDASLKESAVAVALFLQHYPDDFDEYSNLQDSIETIITISRKWTYLLVEIQPSSSSISGPVRLPNHVIEQLILGPTPPFDSFKLYSKQFQAFVSAREDVTLKYCKECACNKDAYCCSHDDDRCMQFQFDCMPCDQTPQCTSHDDCASDQFCSASKYCLSCSTYSQSECLTFDGACCWAAATECAVASCGPTPANPDFVCHQCCVLPISGENCDGLLPEEVDGSCCPLESTCCPLASGLFGRGAWTCCGKGQECGNGKCVPTKSDFVSVGLFFANRPFFLVEPVVLSVMSLLQGGILDLLNSGTSGAIISEAECAAYTALSKGIGTAVLCQVKASNTSLVGQRLDELGGVGDLALGAVEFKLFGEGLAADFFEPFMQWGGFQGCQGHADCITGSYCTRFGDCMHCASMPLIVSDCDSFDNDCCLASSSCGVDFDTTVQCKS